MSRIWIPLIAAGLWLTSLASAAEDSGAGGISNMDLITAAAVSGSTYVPVGYSVQFNPATGGQSANAHIEAINLTTGATIWASLSTASTVYTDVVVNAGRIYTVHVKPDDDGDAGMNLFVVSRRLTDGLTFWGREFEAPDPNEAFSNSVFSFDQGAPDLEVTGGRVIVRARYGGADTVVFRLNATNGNILP